MITMTRRRRGSRREPAAPAPGPVDVGAIREHFEFPAAGRVVTNNAASTQPPRAVPWACGGIAQAGEHERPGIKGRQAGLSRQLASGTWRQALPGVLGVSRGHLDDSPGNPVVEIAIYPDVVGLAAGCAPAVTPWCCRHQRGDHGDDRMGCKPPR